MKPALTTHDQQSVGATAVVRELDGGNEFSGRLAAMGLVLGAALQVMQNSGKGPMLVRVRDTRLALGRGEAQRILVERVPP